MGMKLELVRDAFDHVAKKQRISSSTSEEVIDLVSHEIEQALAKILSFDNPISLVDLKSVLTELRHNINTMCLLNKLDGPKKELSITLSKFPKLLGETFPDISRAYRHVDFDFHIVNQILGSHFYRHGLFELGDCFTDEAAEPDASALRSQFLELHRILDAIKVKNLEPALTWASTNREKLQQMGSNLELKLHSLQFLEIVKGGNRANALEYAKACFAPFAADHMKEIQKLTVCVLWIDKLEKCPYSDLLDPIHWETLTDELNRDFCNLLGHSCRSPLIVVLTAGIEGLPTLLKLENVIAENKEWQTIKHLPVPVEVRKEFQFHSFFVCPVSWEHASKENPPMLLPCLHVICKQSISKLSKGISRAFKCPYCPALALPGQCKQLYF